ncbi:MAG: Hpt domain-containing protein [Burkholderiaceae bacterium]
MLLRLSRTSFRLAAAVSALALLAAGGRGTLLMAVAGGASLAALGLWRSALHRQPAAAAMPVRPGLVLDEPLLRGAASGVERGAQAAASFETALHTVARVLRSELGARGAAVHEVHDVDATHAFLSDLIESQPGFRTVERRVRLDMSALARALREQRPAGQPPDAVALPVVVDGRVVAAIELSAIELPVAPEALARLLDLACSALAQRAQVEGTPAAGGEAMRPNVLVIQDHAGCPETNAGLLRHCGCRVTPVSGMLEGLDALGRTQFDLVLVDVPLAQVEQSEDWRRLRRAGAEAAHAAAARGPVFVAVSTRGETGEAGEEDRFRGLGFDDHIFKPIRQGRMAAMLSRHLLPHPQAPAEADGSAAGGAPGGLDPVAIGRLAELDPTGENRLVQRVLQAFQTSAARLRPQLDAARTADDRAAIRLVAHTLKSSSASIGALELSQLCAQVETAIRLDAAADLGPQLDALDHALDAALQAIAALPKEPG